MTPLIAVGRWTSLALTAVLRGDVESAREQYINLEPMRGAVLPPGLGISSDRVLGLLSATVGRLDQAAVHFEDALALCRRAGRKLDLSYAYYDYAGVMLKRNGQGDREKAVLLLDEALGLASEMGMPPLMERAANLKEQAEALPATIPAFPDGLTQREVEVLRLIAAGKTNLEIAEDLVIAEGTARRHVSNIYEKIGVGNRAEATRYAIREGFVPADDNLISPA